MKIKFRPIKEFIEDTGLWWTKEYQVDCPDGYKFGGIYEGKKDGFGNALYFISEDNETIWTKIDSLSSGSEVNNEQ